MKVPTLIANGLHSSLGVNRIHYRLLRNHGYDEHSPECLELVRRQNSLVRKLDDLSAAMSTWLAMESRLLESIHKHGPTIEVPLIDRELRGSIERHLTQHRSDPVGPTPIPDELWVGSGDIRMRTQDWKYFDLTALTVTAAGSKV